MACFKANFYFTSIFWSLPSARDNTLLKNTITYPFLYSLFFHFWVHGSKFLDVRCECVPWNGHEDSMWLTNPCCIPITVLSSQNTGIFTKNLSMQLKLHLTPKLVTKCLIFLATVSDLRQTYGSGLCATASIITVKKWGWDWRAWETGLWGFPRGCGYAVNGLPG
jgi:hypothetical protein